IAAVDCGEASLQKSTRQAALRMDCVWGFVVLSTLLHLSDALLTHTAGRESLLSRRKRYLTFPDGSTFS
ncbi:hypothetical protein L9F63_016120, partial [Diploptera punctata]